MDGTSDAGGLLFEGFLDGSYDCVDRVVLRAYFQLGQRAAGLRMWWRRWQGSDEGLNNTRLMRVAGRFARRVKGWAKGAGVPVVYSKSGERNEDLAKGYVPDDPGYEGVFVVIVRRAPGNVWDVEHTADGRIRRIKRKVPRPWVNHYAFHIMDRDWGHMIIRFCPHPPFNALVILNGHEWVAKEAERRRLAFQEAGQLLHGAIQRPGPGPCRRDLELSRELCRAPGPGSGALDLLGGAVLRAGRGRPGADGVPLPLLALPGRVQPQPALHERTADGPGLQHPDRPGPGPAGLAHREDPLRAPAASEATQGAAASSGRGGLARDT